MGKSFTAEQSSRTHRKPNQLPSKSSSHHVFQQLNHFPTSSRGLFFGWREIVERLACRDGSTQHRPPWTTLKIVERRCDAPWTTLTTNRDGERCGSTSWEHQQL